MHKLLRVGDRAHGIYQEGFGSYFNKFSPLITQLPPASEGPLALPPLLENILQSLHKSTSGPIVQSCFCKRLVQLLLEFCSHFPWLYPSLYQEYQSLGSGQFITRFPLRKNTQNLLESSEQWSVWVFSPRWGGLKMEKGFCSWWWHGKFQTEIWVKTKE